MQTHTDFPSTCLMRMRARRRNRRAVSSYSELRRRENEMHLRWESTGKNCTAMAVPAVAVPTPPYTQSFYTIYNKPRV